MELFEIKQGLDQYGEKLSQLGLSLDLDSKNALIHELSEQSMADDLREGLAQIVC